MPSPHAGWRHPQSPRSWVRFITLGSDHVRRRTGPRNKEPHQVNSSTHAKIVSFIWGIADDVLRDLYVRGKYRDVILPFTVLRRLDSVLEPTKKAVLSMKSALDANQIDN